MYKKPDSNINKKITPYLYYFLIHKLKNTCLWIFNKMHENNITVSFLLTNLTFTNSYTIYFVNFQKLCWRGTDFDRRKIVFF